MSGEWREVSLAHVAKITSGKRPGHVLKEPDGTCQIPVIGGGGISGFTDSHLFQGGVLITGRVGTLGKLFAPTGACWPSDNALVVRPLSSDTDLRFLRYALQNVIAATVGMNRGAANPLITQDDLGRLRIGFPEFSEQRAIAHILGTLDDKIELNRRRNQTLEAMARALFKDWFVDFGPVRAKMEGREPYLPADLWQLFPDRLVESELGEIPEGWEIAKIEAVLKRLPAKVRYTKDQVSSYGKTPVFEQGASIILGFHDGDAFYQASADDPAFVFGDHTCITKLSCQPFDISQNVIPLRGQSRPTMWVYYAINEKQKFEEYRRHWMELITKSLIIAPNHICLEFSMRATAFHIQIEQNERESRTLAQIRDTLLPKLVSGKLRVKDTEKFMERVEAQAESQPGRAS